MIWISQALWRLSATASTTLHTLRTHLLCNIVFPPSIMYEKVFFFCHKKKIMIMWMNYRESIHNETDSWHCNSKIWVMHPQVSYRWVSNVCLVCIYYIIAKQHAASSTECKKLFPLPFALYIVSSPHLW